MVATVEPLGSLDSTVVTITSTEHNVALEKARLAMSIADPEVADARLSLVTVDGVYRLPTSNPAINQTDFMLELARGNVTGMSGVSKFGRNPVIADGTTREVWDGGATAYVFPATVAITHINTSVDQAALRGELVEIQGLDASWNLTVQQCILDASDTSTPVELATALIRVFRMKLLSGVVGSTSVRVHNAGDTVNYALIEPGNNQTLMAIYTIPNGKTGYLVSFYTSLNSAAQIGPTGLTVRVWERDNDNGYAPQIKHVTGLDPDATSSLPQHSYTPYKKITQKTDLWIDATPAGKAADVSAGFDLILVDN